MWMAAMVAESADEYVPALRYLEGIMTQVNVYDTGLKEARDIVGKPENSEILKVVKEKNLEADRQFAKLEGKQKNPTEQMIDRVAMRLAKFDGIQISADLDKTLTISDKYLNLLPHARQFENFMDKHGREVLPFVMARYAREALIFHKSVYEKVGSTLEFRPGVEDFFQLTKDQGIPVSVTSANFRVIVSSCLDNLPAEKRDHLIYITGLSTNDITAIDKEIVIARRVLINPDKANILCVDGLSDQGCLQGVADGISACIFVLPGTKFVEEVKKTGQPYFEFSDFHEVNNIFKQILIRKEQLQS